MIDKNTNFGDSELRYVGFSHDELIMKVWLSDKDDFVTLTLGGVDYAILETNNMQNVIEDIRIYDSWSAALEDVDFRSSDIVKKLDSSKTESNLRVCYVKPISGSESVIFFQDIHIE